MRSNGSVAATYGTVTKTGTGTFTPASGGTAPYEHYGQVQINFILGTTAVGVTGATYTTSVDGGNTVSAVQALGTASSIVIPNTGITITLGAGSIVAGDAITFFTERALLNNTDVTAALAVLLNTRLAWEMVLIDCQYSAGTVGLIDTWLGSLESQGQFKIGLINTRFLLEPTPATETPATFAAAMATLTSGDASNRMCVGADGGHATSLITGYFLKRPTALALAAMACSLTPNIGTDPAYVGGAGPVPGFQTGLNGQPNDWDEAVYGGTVGILDPLRLTTLRTFPPGPDSPAGTFITNANVLITAGSPIAYIQILRCLNKACRISWANLNTQLGRGVNLVTNAQTGNNNIDPADAHDIEGLVNPPVAAGLAGQVTATNFALSRDDILNVAGAAVTAVVEVQAKFYLKGIIVTAAIVKSISVPLGGV
jgi:hypothetical protein